MYFPVAGLGEHCFDMLSGHVIGDHFPIWHTHFRPLSFDVYKVELDKRTFLEQRAQTIYNEL